MALALEKLVGYTETAGDLTAKNPVVKAGRIVQERDTKKIKIGDGVTEWTDLSYLSSGIAEAGEPEDAIADASEAHALNSTFSDTEAEAALNALGVKINAILEALRAKVIIDT